MKLLGWMHRKFRQNSNETPKDFTIGFTGQPSLEDQHCYPRGSRCNKPFGRSLRERNSYPNLDNLKDEYLEEEPPTDLTELFHGFLAIGTLGTEPITTDTTPATPTFSISVDHIAEKETEVTENELKLINDELEKVLGAELKDESCYSSSGRNSHVSAGRISHCSTITLSGKPIEGVETDGNGAIICPLQSYLFGSAVEQTDMTPPARKEQRTSLGELFQKSKLAEENSGAKSERAEKRLEKESEKSAVHLMKKILKKKMLHATSRSAGGTNDSAGPEKKLHKILHIFNRKVHPENTISGNQTHKPIKNEMKHNNTYEAISHREEMESTDEHITIYPQRAISKKSACISKNQFSSCQLIKGSGDTAANELWVKTDADYLVLEL